MYNGNVVYLIARVMNTEKIACGIWILMYLFTSLNGEYESKWERKFDLKKFFKTVHSSYE